MKNFRKILLMGMLSASMVVFGAGLVSAEDANVPRTGTILPVAGSDCPTKLSSFEANPGLVGKNQQVLSDTLGCAISTGRISLEMVPYFIKYLSNYVLGLISLVALLFVVIGGVLYTGGTMVEQKDQGKAYIKNALIGMVISFLAWSIVNVVLSIVTG